MPVVAPSSDAGSSPAVYSFFPVRSMTWKHVQNIATTQSPFTLSTQRQDWNAQVLAATVTLKPLKRAQAAAIQAALIEGVRNPLMFGPVGEQRFPQGDAKNIDPAVTPVLATAAAIAGGNSVAVGFPLLSATALRALDYVQIGQHLYFLRTDAVTDAGGNATLNLFPNLRAPVAIGDAITFLYPQGQFYVASNVLQWDLDSSMIASVAFDLVEAY